MQIASIEVIRVAIPYSDESVAQGEHTAEPSTGEVLTGFYKSKVMESLLVKVTTDDGHAGWGEAFGHMINSSTYAALVDTVGPFFMGAPVDSSDALTASPRIEQAHKAFHLFGRTGPALYAISALDIALWDLKAQALGKPLYKVLGGTRDQIRAYASLVPYNENTAAVVHNAMQAYEAGFRDVKLHETEFETIQAVRKALPADARLMVDVNCPWSAQEAVTRAAKLKQLGLAWLEEPIWPPDDFESLAELRKTGVPLAAGENASGIDGYERYLKAGALDVIQPSVIKLGGITAMLQARGLGRQYQTRVQPHCFYYGAGLVATAHVVAAMDDTALLEVPWVKFAALLTPAMQPRARVPMSQAPGLGFDPDPGLVDKFLIARTLLG
jgi:L-alanine-DL-glutamate epimerase-like enolase superfamily enzyme